MPKIISSVSLLDLFQKFGGGPHGDSTATGFVRNLGGSHLPNFVQSFKSSHIARTTDWALNIYGHGPRDRGQYGAGPFESIPEQRPLAQA